MLYKSYIHLREATRKCTRHTRAFQKRKARYVNVHFRLCYYYENANMHYLAQSARQAKDFAKYPPLEFTATEKVNSKKSFARSNEIMHAAYSCFSKKKSTVCQRAFSSVLLVRKC